MQKTVEKLLVTVNEGIEFMGKCKHHMKVGRIDDFSPSFIHPDFFKDSLTVRTVSVSTGVVVDLHMSTVCTLTDAAAKFSSLAVQNGMRSLFLDTRLVMPAGEVFVGRLPDLGDFTVCQSTHLQTDQRD